MLSRTRQEARPFPSPSVPDEPTYSNLLTETGFPPDFFVSLISIPPILDCLFSFLEISIIFRVSWTCRAALFAVGKYIRRAFSFDAHFSHFFDKPHEFRKLLAQTKSVVSGSNALQFFTRLVWAESDMDLYVYENEIGSVVEWLTSEGYEFSPRSGQPSLLDEALGDEVDVKDYASDLVTHGLVYVLDFSKKSGGKLADRTRVQVLVCSPRVSVLDLIFQYRSTCVLNVITHKAAYCVYPHCTLQNRETIYFDRYGDARRYPYGKYEVRGWKPVSWHSIWGASPINWRAEHVHNARSLGDKYCWSIIHHPQHEHEEDPLTKIRWRLGEAGDGPQRLFTRMESFYKI